MRKYAGYMLYMASASWEQCVICSALVLARGRRGVTLEVPQRGPVVLVAIAAGGANGAPS